MVDFSSVQPLEEQARAQEQKALGLQSSAATLPDMLRKALSERLTSSPLYGQREQVAQNYITSAPQARVDVANLVKGGTILSPTQQQAIIAGKKASAAVPLMSLNDLLQLQTGGVEGIIGSGTNAFNTLLTSELGKAQQARTTATTEWNKLMQQAQLEEEQRQFDISQANKRGGGGLLEGVLAALLGQQQPQVALPTEPRPTGTPSAGLIYRTSSTGGVIRSQGGEWAYDADNGEWVPIGD